MKRIRTMILVLVSLFISMILYAQTGDESSRSEPPSPEVWAYLVEGSERAYTGREPITDICYFRSIINYRGELVGATPIPATVTIPDDVRTHLVIAELSNAALTHFILME